MEDKIPIDYRDYSNGALAFIPAAILFLSLVIIAVWYFSTGAPAILGVEFTGGTEVRVSIDDSAEIENVEDIFEEEPTSIQSVSTSDTYIVTFPSDTDTNTVEQQIQSTDGATVLAVDSVSASFGSNTQQVALGGLLVAFGGMSIIVFLFFRSFIPSLTVILSAFSDIMVPIAIMNITGIEMTLGTVAALLMLIGYSVDSDIVLNDHILRQPGDFYESTFRAMTTGLTMSLTSMSAMAVLAISAFIFQIEILAAIGFILAVGITVDIMNTYLLNLSILRWYQLGDDYERN